MDDKGKPFGEFASMLPGLVNWVLDMPEAEMREYLMETNKKVDFFARHHQEQILKSNQIMDWMSHCVVFDPGVSSAVGIAKTSAGTTYIYSNWDEWLYASYCEFSRGSNSNILGRSRFESLVMDVCVHQLGLNVYKMKQTRGMRVNNIAVRDSNKTKYNDYPSIVEVGMDKEHWKEFYGETLFKKSDVRIEELEMVS
jgi:putative DNA primase/helicase